MYMLIIFLMIFVLFCFVTGIQKREKLIQFWRNQGGLYRGDNTGAAPYELRIHT